MNTPVDRKKIISALAGIKSADQQERLSYGTYVKELRLRLNMTQQELADASDVSPRTIRNIERQNNAGQVDVLIRIFRALGLELEDASWSAETDRYLRMIAPLIERLSPATRLTTMTDVLALLSDAINADVSGVREDYGLAASQMKPGVEEDDD